MPEESITLRVARYRPEHAPEPYFDEYEERFGGGPALVFSHSRPSLAPPGPLAPSEGEVEKQQVDVGRPDQAKRSNRRYVRRPGWCRR